MFSCKPPPMAERKGFVPRRKPKGKRSNTVAERYFISSSRTRSHSADAAHGATKKERRFTFPYFGATYSKSALWRRGRDSNPCGVSPKRFSRPPRYDRFDTSPFVSLPWAGRASNGCAKVFSNNSPEKTDVGFCPCGASAAQAKRRARHSPCDESIITTEADVVNYFGKQA